MAPFCMIKIKFYDKYIMYKFHKQNNLKIKVRYSYNPHKLNIVHLI